ncbi:hypothetical protein SK128_023507 [Halocaridina rubra]|uniref:C2H2-type domain-containing protein n=1 Tax=Halocaridina rubra TaxID=373956 RepID=A0AAN9AAZ9_HALRR
MKSHTGETETSCKVCNKTFSRKSYLWAHMRVHTDERPYGCNYCTKWFKQYSTWKNHERTHTGEKPYKCSHCNALFSTRSSVSKHIQYAHYHIRDHVCSVCDKRFISKAKLSDHTKTHTGERPYECPICSRAFSRKSNLRYHMYTHSENKRFRCELCQEGFMRRSAVENHILDRHGNVEVMIGSSPSDPNKCKTENEMLTATENEMLTATAPFITVIDADDMTGEDTYIVVYADEGREMDVTDELQNNLQDATSNNQVPVSIIHTPVRRAATMSISNISTQSSGSSRYSSSANEEVLSIENDETSSHLGIHVSEDI